MYLTKEKFSLKDLAEVHLRSPRVLLVINEETLRNIYRKHLETENFFVNPVEFSEIFEVYEGVKDADILILDFEVSVFYQRLDFLKSLRKAFPGLPVVTVGESLGEDMLTMLMSAGIVGHIDRKYTRPQDLLCLIKTVI